MKLCPPTLRTFHTFLTIVLISFHSVACRGITPYSPYTAPTPTMPPSTSTPSTHIQDELTKDMKLPGGELRHFDACIEAKGSQQILDALTENERSQLTDENMPLRYFRAHKGNIQSAIAGLQHTLQWRHDFHVPTITSAFDTNGDLQMRAILTKENATGKVYVRGYDKRGRAILYLRPAMENTKHCETDQMRHLVYHVERAVACTMKNGLEKYVVIMDYTGVQLSTTPTLSATKRTTRILEQHYPERMHKAYICNPPFVFRSFWKLIKKFVDRATRQRIVFCVGKSGEHIMGEDFDKSVVEPCAFGTNGGMRDFDSKEYLAGVFTTAFDECIVPTPENGNCFSQ